MKTNPMFIVFAALPSFIIFLLMETFFMRVFYTLCFFVFALLLQLYLFTQKKIWGLRILGLPRLNYVAYLIGAVASLLVILVSPPAYSITASYVAFTSMTPLQFLRMLSGYFLLSIFPGYIMYKAFLKNSGLQGLEKAGLILSLSFAISIILGFTLRFAGIGISPPSLILVLWLFVCSVEAVSRLASKKVRHVSAQRVEVNMLELGLLATAFACLLFSSYTIVLSSEPTDFALGGDVARYVDVTNGFLLNQRVEPMTYIWLQFFIAEASSLTGLYPTYAFAGLQYLIILLPTATYLLLKAICRKSEKAPAIGAAFISSLSGLGAIGIYGLYSTYGSGMMGVWSALNEIFTKIGLGGPSNHMFIPATIDYAVGMLAGAYAMRYLEAERKNSRNLLLSALLFNVAIFSHSIFFTSCILTALFIYSLVYRKLKRTAQILLMTLAFLISLDILSGFNFSIQIFNYYLHASVFFLKDMYFHQLSSAASPLAVLALAFISIYAISSALKKKLATRSFPKLSLPKSNVLRKAAIKVGFVVLSLIVLLVAARTWQINYSEVNLLERYWNPLYVFPWYIFPLNYGACLLITLSLTPIIVAKCDRKALTFLAAWLVSMVLLALMGIMAPNFLPPSIWTNRFLLLISLPLMFSSSLALSHVRLPSYRIRFHFTVTITLKDKQLSFALHRHPLRIAALAMLSFLLVLSFLSYAYNIEMFYAGSYASESLSASEAYAYQWIHNNVPKDSVILTYSYTSSLRLTSLAGRPVISFKQMDPKVVAWPLGIALYSSTPETLLYSLHQLGVRYILLTSTDVEELTASFGNSAFLLLVDSLPTVYDGEDVSIYEIPRNPLYSDANRVLIVPTLDFTNQTRREYMAGHDFASLDRLYPVDDKVYTDSVAITGEDVLNHTVWEAKQPHASYFAWMNLSIPTELSPIVEFRIRGTENSMFNIGFSSDWFHSTGYWYTGEQFSYTDTPHDWTTMRINLKDLCGTGETLVVVDIVSASSDGEPASVFWDYIHVYLQPFSCEEALIKYRTAFNALALSNTNFTLIPDVELSKLRENDVYFFPCNWHLKDELYERLMDEATMGAHIVVLDSSFASFDEFSLERGKTLLNNLGIELGETFDARSITFADGFNLNLRESYRPSRLITSDPSVNVLANYVSENGSKSPYVLQKVMGKGSINFVYLEPLLDSSILKRIDQRELFTHTMAALVRVLPEPNVPKSSLELPYPSDLYKLLNPSLLDIYRLKGLDGYLYGYDDLSINGNITLTSEYLLWEEDILHFKELSITNGSGGTVMENGVLRSLSIEGEANVTVGAASVTIPNTPTTVLTQICAAPPTRVHLLLNGKAEATITVEDGGVTRRLDLTRGEITIMTADVFDGINMWLRQPDITINGELETSWQGAFWHQGTLYTTVAMPRRYPIRGTFSLQILYCSGTILARLSNIRDVAVIIPEAG